MNTLTNLVHRILARFDDHLVEIPEEKDRINPDHYKVCPKGIERECITYSRWLPFDQGNAAKYVYRAGNKDPLAQDLNKAKWYIEDALKYELIGQIPAGLIPTINPEATTRSFLFFMICTGQLHDALRYVESLLAVHELSTIDL